MKIDEKRILTLDVVRGIAILMVVLYHYAVRYHNIYGDEPLRSFALGKLGVELFFILSGLFIYHSLLKSSCNLDFFKKRLIRLYPSYWICLTITFAITTFFGLPGREVNVTTFLINYSMLQFGLGVPSVDGVYWSLFYELAFYVFMTISFSLAKSRQQNWFLVLWLLIYCVNNIAISSPIIAVLFSLDYGPLFLSGIYFYKLMKEKSFINVVMPLSALALFIHFNELDVARNIVLSSFFALFYLFSFKILNLKYLSIIAYLAPWSYEWYLLHQNIGYIILRHLYSTYGVNHFFILIPIIFTAALAYAIHRYLERLVHKKLSLILFKANKITQDNG